MVFYAWFITAVSFWATWGRLFVFVPHYFHLSNKNMFAAAIKKIWMFFKKDMVILSAGNNIQTWEKPAWGRTWAYFCLANKKQRPAKDQTVVMSAKLLPVRETSKMININNNKKYLIQCHFCQNNVQEPLFGVSSLHSCSQCSRLMAL